MGLSALSDLEAAYVRYSEEPIKLRSSLDPQPGRAVGIHGEFICFYMAVSDCTCKTHAGFVNCMHILSFVWFEFYKGWVSLFCLPREFISIHVCCFFVDGLWAIRVQVP